MLSQYRAIFLALLAAVLFALSIPIAKYFLVDVPPLIVASFLYLGAGLAMGVTFVLQRNNPTRAALLGKEDSPYVISMVLLDILAPILLLFGLKLTSSANASLLVNAEIVFTAVVAALVFREKISRLLSFAILLILFASVILTFEGTEALTFNIGSLLVLGAALCWGIENNCTRAISTKNSEQIVMVKGLGSAAGSLLVAQIAGTTVSWGWELLGILVLGALSYGVSINIYVKAQRTLGAARTSAYYALNPFLGVLFSLIFLGERPVYGFYLGLLLMLVATILLVREEFSREESS
ncbi:MAG: DMT family transporter [Arcanobacterium sp.]|nr:DMT family transporter [Arcanobacterium sp.]